MTIILCTIRRQHASSKPTYVSWFLDVVKCLPQMKSLTCWLEMPDSDSSQHLTGDAFEPRQITAYWQTSGTIDASSDWPVQSRTNWLSADLFSVGSCIAMLVNLGPCVMYEVLDQRHRVQLHSSSNELCKMVSIHNQFLQFKAL